jgi:hypothetical protein
VLKAHLFIPDVTQEQIVKAICVAHGITAQTWRPKAGQSDPLAGLPAGARLIADVRALAGAGAVGTNSLTRDGLVTVLVASRAVPIHALHRRFATEAGARIMVPALSPRDGSALSRYGQRIVEAFGVEFDARRTRQFISGLTGVPASDADINNAHKTLGWFEAHAIDWRELVNALARDNALGHADRSWRMMRFAEVFDARNGIDVVQKLLSTDRQQALLVCRAFTALGVFRHAVGTAHFDDTELFFRMHWPDPRLAQLRVGALIERIADATESRNARGAPPMTGARIIEQIARLAQLGHRDARTVAQTTFDVGALLPSEPSAKFSERESVLINPALKERQPDLTAQ